MGSHKADCLTLCGSSLLGLAAFGLNQAAMGTWKALDSGLNNTAYSLNIYNGQLVAGGNFVVAGGQDVNNIASWDGASWQPLGGGTNSAIYALAVYNDELIAGGAFTTAEGQTVNRIARWNGKSWQPLGNGMTESYCDGGGARVEALTTYNDELIAGGCFSMAGTANAIARWDGSSWDSLGDEFNGPTGHVRALTVYNGELIAGGSINITVNGQEGYYVARWNGAWQTMGNPGGGVYALAVYEGDLIAGGQTGVRRWNGASWEPLSADFNCRVNALTEYGGDLIVGGSFTFEDGFGAIFNRIARWDGGAWQPMDTGMNLPVVSLTVLGDHAIAGGDFTFASNEPANRIARWAPCPGDPTEDDVVGVDDLLLVINFWGEPRCSRRHRRCER
ncbi:MAG: hypothetical protein L0219_17275 [Phycisphaerales bacterium]|nr:hypothetical protein [Phycisphaerales bacterium]